MALPSPKQLPLDREVYGFDETRARMRDSIASVRQSVLDSRRSISEAQVAIASADEISARQISDPDQVTLPSRR